MEGSNTVPGVYSNSTALLQQHISRWW